MEVIEPGLGATERTLPRRLALSRALGGARSCPSPMAIIECHTWEAFVDGRRFASVRLLDSMSTATAGSCTHVLPVRSWLEDLLLFLAGLAETRLIGVWACVPRFRLMGCHLTVPAVKGVLCILWSHGIMYGTKTPPQGLDSQAMAAASLLGLAL